MCLWVTCQEGPSGGKDKHVYWPAPWCITISVSRVPTDGALLRNNSALVFNYCHLERFMRPLPAANYCIKLTPQMDFTLSGFLSVAPSVSLSEDISEWCEMLEPWYLQWLVPCHLGSETYWSDHTNHWQYRMYTQEPHQEERWLLQLCGGGDWGGLSGRKWL